MYKNQLQELAQRSCFNLPAYTCLREGPDHAPRFKASVNFNGELFDSPGFFTTLRQAEHAAAEVALAALARRGPAYSLAVRILDETGVYKNLLQEVAQRVGAPLPSYSTERSGFGHQPVFTCTVELAAVTFTGDPAKNKKQAEKNAASAAWSSLKQLARQEANSLNEPENNDEQEQIRIARALLNYRLEEKMAMGNYPHASPFPKKFPMQLDRKPSFGLSSHSSHSKILPMFRPRSNSRSRPEAPASTDGVAQSTARTIESLNSRSRFPAAGAAPYVPVGHHRMPCHSMAPPITIRTAVPVFSAPPLPPTPERAQQLPPLMGHPPPIRMASSVRMRPASPMFAPSPVQGPRHGVPVQLKDMQFQSIMELASPLIPVQVKYVKYRPPKEAIPVQVKDVQQQLPIGSLSPAILIKTKDVHPQQLKDSLSLDKSVLLPTPLAAIRSSVKIEAQAEIKEASKVVTSEVPCSTSNNAAAAESVKKSDVFPTEQLRTAEAGDKKTEAEHETEAQVVAEAAIKQLEIN